MKLPARYLLGKKKSIIDQLRELNAKAHEEYYAFQREVARPHYALHPERGLPIEEFKEMDRLLTNMKHLNDAVCALDRLRGVEV